MKTLVVAATAAEIGPIEPTLRGHRDIEVLITGVGMVATAAHCSRRLAERKYAFVLNLGLCGSFDPSLPEGTVVHVVSDRLSELGAEDGDRFLAIESLPLPTDHVVENPAVPQNAALAAVPTVSGITVNTVHGDPATIAEVVARCRPQVESMEGAAFMYSCRLAGVPYAQVRAVSNLVARRNRASWKISEAVDALAAVARAILQLS
jgi:futalosine hydrolase